MRSSTTRSIRRRSARRAADRRRRRSSALRSPNRLRAASRSGRSASVHASGRSRWRSRTSSGVNHGAHIRRNAGTDHRSPTRSVASSIGHARPTAAARDSLRCNASCTSSRSRSSSPMRRCTVSARYCQTAPRASLCGVPASGAVNASAQSRRRTVTSAHSVSTRSGSVGGSSYHRTAISIASTIPAVDFSAVTASSVSGTAVSPSATRSRNVHVCTPSSPRLGKTSATYDRYCSCGPTIRRRPRVSLASE